MILGKFILEAFTYFSHECFIQSIFLISHWLKAAYPHSYWVVTIEMKPMAIGRQGKWKANLGAADWQQSKAMQ